MVLDYIASVFSLGLKVFTFWTLLTGILFWKRPLSYKRSSPATRFACLIPARNEETVISALIRSLQDQNYPDGLYDIYVIPNNCTDQTEAAARAAGAKIYHCNQPVKFKGDALHQAVSWLLGKDYDAFCLFDADNIVHPDFLSHMNDAINCGARVAKARLMVKNPACSWVSGCYSLYFALNDTFFSRSRANYGLSAKLVGTGLAIHRSVFERMGGWNTMTIAEDAEFSAKCAEIGERVWWVPEAVTYNEAPTSFKVSLTQRKRWCSGIMSAAEVMLPRLFRARKKVNKLRLLDMAFFLSVPFAQAFSVIPLMLHVLSACLCKALIPWSFTAAFALGTTYLGTVAFAVILKIIAAQRMKLSSLLLFPLFMASFLPLNVLSLLRRTKEWKVIQHSYCSYSIDMNSSVQSLPSQ